MATYPRQSDKDDLPHSRNGWTELDFTGKLIAAFFVCALAGVLAANAWLRGEPRTPRQANDSEEGLFAAVERGDVAAAEEVLTVDPGAVHDPLDPSMPDQPLHRASQRGDAAMVDLLLRAGAQVDARGAGGATALHYAVCGDHVQTAACLLTAGADPRAVDAAGETPIALARSPRMLDLFRRQGER